MHVSNTELGEKNHGLIEKAGNVC